MKRCSSSRMSQQQQLLGLEGPVGRQLYYLKLTRIDASATICIFDYTLMPCWLRMMAMSKKTRLSISP